MSELPDATTGLPSTLPNGAAGPLAAPSAPQGAGPAPEEPGNFQASDANQLADVAQQQAVRGTGAPAPQAAPPPRQNFAQQAMSALGHATMATFGQGVEYQQDARGNTIAVPVQQKPGQLFKNILAGALLGSALGSGSPSFAQGMSRGAAGAMQRNDSLDKEKYERAQKDAQNRREQQRVDLEKDRTEMERQRTTAQIAMWHTQQVGAEQESDHRNQEWHQARNDRARALDQMLGGNQTLAPIAIGDQMKSTLTADEVMQAAKENPSVLQAPTKGYHRVFTSTTDLANIKYNGHSWVDDAGDPVNMTGKTTIQVHDVPDQVMEKPQQVSNAELVKLYPILKTMPGFDPKGTSPLTPAQAIAMASAAEKDAKEKASTDLTIARTKAENALIGKQIAMASIEIQKGKAWEQQSNLENVKIQLEGLQQQAKLVDAMTDPEKATEIRNEIKATTQAFDKATKDWQQAMRDAQAGKKTSAGAPKLPKPAKPGDVVTPSVVSAYLAANNNDLMKAKQAAEKDGWSFSPTPQPAAPGPAPAPPAASQAGFSGLSGPSETSRRPFDYR